MNSRIIFGVIGLSFISALALYNYSLPIYKKVTGQVAPYSLPAIPERAQKANKITTKREVTTVVVPNGNTTTTTKELTVVELKRNNRVSIDIQCREASLLSGTCKDRVYGLGFEKRVFDSPVFIGGGMDSKGGIKLSTSVEF